MADSTKTLEIVINAKDNASKEVNKFKGSFASAVKDLTMGSAIITGVLGLVSKSVVGIGIDMESARTSFVTFLGSGERAGKLLKELSDFAVKTPFDLPQVVDGSKRLLAYGLAAESIIPTFRMLGDLSSGNKDKFNALTLAFGQVRAATKLTGAELRQFTEAGIPLLDALAKQSGKTAGQVKEDMENGIAPSFKDVEKALQGLTSEGGMFFNNMDSQSKTLGGTLSNVRDEFSRFALSVLGFTKEGEIRAGSIFFYLKEGATKLLGALQEIRPEVTAFFDGFMRNTPAVIGLIAALTAMMLPLAIATIAATWPILAVGVAAGIAGFEVATMADRFMTLKDNTTLFESVLALLFPSMDTLVSKNLDVKYATEANENAQRNLKAQIDLVKDSEDALVGKNIDLEGANLRVERATINYTDALKKHGEKSLEVREAALNLKRANEGVETATKAVWDQVDANTKQFNEDYIPATKKAQEAGKNLETANNGIAGTFDRVRDAIGGALAKLGEWLKQKANESGGGRTYQHGGFISGPVNQAVPAILHGGERVVPRTGVDVNSGGSGGAVSINISGNFQLDSDSRMQSFADMVIDKLNRQNELASRGVSV